MSKSKKSTVDVQGTTVSIVSSGNDDYLSLTDIAKYKNPDHADDVIRNWLRNRNTIEFLGVWERLNNSDFNPVEFDGIKIMAGLNSFTLTPKQWIEKSQAIGIVSRAGRYGGTYAHKDIAFEFASWISVEFKLYLIKEFQRLKDDENRRLSLSWNLNRTLSKLNYRIHTDAIREHLIPPEITPAQVAITYASEADILNIALFGLTAKEWRDANPKLEAIALFLVEATTGIIEGMRLIGVGFAPELRAICARQKGQKGIAERVLLIHSAFTTKDMVRHAIAKTVFKEHS